MKEYIKRSPLYNPYEEGNVILKWAVAVYRKSRANKYRSRILGNDQIDDDELEEGTALYYNNAGGTRDFDYLIPEWDITLSDLQEVYDKARFDRYLDWKQTYFFCFETDFKRRIPWLYPDNGRT